MSVKISQQMRVFVAYWHPEPRSFNVAMFHTACETLTATGNDVRISDHDPITEQDMAEFAAPTLAPDYSPMSATFARTGLCLQRAILNARLKGIQESDQRLLFGRS
jgi:hypothetical protein